MYTDKPYTPDDFSLSDKLNVYFKIGIKNKYSINILIQKLNLYNINYNKIVIEDDFLYFYFENLCDYKDVIKLLVLNVKK